MALQIPHSFTHVTWDHRDPVQDFAQKYGIRELNVSQDYREFQYRHSPLSSYDYINSPYERNVNISMPMSALQHLVKKDSEGDLVLSANRKEAYMREKHPAIKDAWEKYQMLITLMDR